VREESILKAVKVTAMSIACLMLANTVMAMEMPELARGSNYCSVCHKVDAKSIGPSWMDISKFYNGKMEHSTSGKTVQEAVGGVPVEQFLIKKISAGGHGNWGSQPMLANDNVYNVPNELKQKQIKELVDYILSLDK